VWVLERLSNVLVSIDGGEAITDGYRGRGIYRQVLKNLRQVRPQIGGSVTARVTWGNPADHLRGTGRAGRRRLALRLAVLAVRRRRDVRRRFGRAPPRRAAAAGGALLRAPTGCTR
jgi:hypothetical protein